MRNNLKKAILMMLLFVFTITSTAIFNPTRVDAASVSISKKSSVLIKGQKLQLKIKGTKKKVKWSSSKKEVATVTAKGKVTAKKKGQAKINAKVGSKTYTCTVNVITPSLNKTSATIYAGNTTSLYFKGSTQKAKWSSSNTSIATVTTKGVVRGLKAGKVTITANLLGKKYTCKVTVKDSCISVDKIPAYSGNPYVVINGNKPNFSAEEKNNKKAFELYSDLDKQGRCGTAYANICKEIQPTEARGDISSIHPSGWHSNMGWERCHLIGYQLAGENANEKNLITGTHYFNVTGMLPFENKVDDYVDDTNHHVLYRVTPVFTGKNLIADGVLMEAWSVEDNGTGVCFNVFVYNVQPGKTINYKTGEVSDNPDDNSKDPSAGYTYVLNTNTKKFHYSSCGSVKSMSEKNKEYFTGTREEIIALGYSPDRKSVV